MQLVSIDTLVFDPVMEGLKATDGIVIDLRLCSGGSLLVSENIWNRFIDSEIKVGSQIYRDGPKHDDFAEPIIVVTEPRGNWQYLKPIAVLIGNFSGSVGEVFAETFSQFEHAVLLGETTRMSVTAPGSFLLNDGTKYRVPIVAYLDMFDQPLEGVGVSPDIHIANEEVVNNSEKDVIIDKAFEWIGATTQMAVIPTIPLVSSLK